MITSTALIRRHYRRIGVIPGWGSERFLKLCAMLNFTPAEVGALTTASPDTVAGWIKDNHIPPAQSLHLAFLEATVVEMNTGQKINIVPVQFLGAGAKP